MPPPFLQVAIPVLYVWDKDHVPSEAPGMDLNLLPIISRALKVHAGTGQVTVITGSPTTPDELPEAFTRLGLQYPELERASPEAANLLAAEFIADNFDAELVQEHLQRILEERRKAAEEQVGR
ncbi:MAG: hypothetical protein LC624_00580 [Halobacteriales archaeon]|nr:hypothetical protein [Halobacteriales archaeon]